jgi:hypothetical protein
VKIAFGVVVVFQMGLKRSVLFYCFVFNFRMRLHQPCVHRSLFQKRETYRIDHFSDQTVLPPNEFLRDMDDNKATQQKLLLHVTR